MKTSSLFQSFRCAFAGLADALRTGRNFRIHSVIAIAVITAAFVENLSRTEWAILALTIGVVFSAELANTAIEHVVDMVSPGPNDLARRAKDVAAASVLCVAIAAVVVGLMIFHVL